MVLFPSTSTSFREGKTEGPRRPLVCPATHTGTDARNNASACGFRDVAFPLPAAARPPHRENRWMSPRAVGEGAQASSLEPGQGARNGARPWAEPKSLPSSAPHDRKEVYIY